MRFSSEDFDFDDEEGFEESEIIADAVANRQMELELAEKHMRLDLLDKAVAIAKSGWFWGFLSYETRISRVVDTYLRLRKIMD